MTITVINTNTWFPPSLRVPLYPPLYPSLSVCPSLCPPFSVPLCPSYPLSLSLSLSVPLPVPLSAPPPSLCLSLWPLPPIHSPGHGGVAPPVHSDAAPLTGSIACLSYSPVISTARSYQLTKSVITLLIYISEVEEGGACSHCLSELPQWGSSGLPSVLTQTLLRAWRQLFIKGWNANSLSQIQQTGSGGLGRTGAMVWKHAKWCASGGINYHHSANWKQ